MPVFVTDGDQRATLAVTRSLGRRGIEVLVGEERASSLSSSSRYCTEHVTYPSPLHSPDRFYHFFLEFLQKTSVDVVLPITDLTTHLVLPHKKEIEQHTRLPMPHFEAFDFVSNKWKVLQHAEEIGIPIPKTYFVEGIESLPAIRDQIEYPVVVKGGRSRIRTEKGWLLTNVHYAKSPEELIQLYRGEQYLQYPSLIQERILGPGLGLFVLFNQGELVTVFSHKRLREKPPSGGVSVLRESIPVHPDLREQAVRLFQPLRWHGVAMMEYKLDQRTGRAVLIEINGRFWGSLDLAIAAGVDFPYLLYRVAVREDIDAPQAYRVSVKSRWLLGDLDHLLLRLFRKDQDLNLPEGSPSRIGALLRFLKFYEPGLYYEVLSLRDLRPFIYEVSQYLRSFNGKREAIKE
jgi:predicted ATP-grasp superfamily ATP-dependent carboligase